MRGLVVVVGVGILAALAIQHASATPQPTAVPYAVPVTLNEVGIVLEPVGPNDVPRVTEDQAIRQAADAAGQRGDLGNPFSVQLVRLTDLNYGPDGGPLVIDNRLVWLVRLTGVPQPVYGGIDPATGAAHAALVPADEIATELNVVIDAMTGEHLESFSFR